jgi:protein TonB
LLNIFQEFFNNGQLHQVIEYKQNAPLNHIATFNRKGDSLNGGTLCRGNGTHIIYNINASPAGKVKKETLVTFKNSGKNGPVRYYYESGKLRTEAFYKDGIIEGGWQLYTEKGEATETESDFIGSRMLAKIELNSDQPGDRLYFNFLERAATTKVMPTFQFGEDELKSYLKRHLRYPSSAKKAGIEGTVYTTFTIDQNGDVKLPAIISGINPELDAEAIRVINAMPRWNPGSIDGVPVSVQYNLPVKFRL